MVKKNLRQWRMTRGYTREELSKKAGVSLTTVFNYETYGVKNARNSTLKKVTDALEINAKKITFEAPFKKERVVDGKMACRVCKISKDLNEKHYYKRKNTFGFNLVCIECIKKERNQRYANGKRTRNKELEKKYYKENRESILKKAKERRLQNYETALKKERQASRRRRSVNPIAVKIENQRRRAKEKELPNDLTVSDWNDALDYFGCKCAYCGKSNGDLHQEHVIPVFKDGGYTKSNIIPSCPSCNFSKGAKCLDDWYPFEPFYQNERAKKYRNT